MPIFLLSETSCPNINLRNKLISEIKKHGGKIAYISSIPQDEQKIRFYNTVSEYQNIDPSITLEYFDLGEKFSDNDLKKVLEFGIIHMSGGNTFGFLNYINKRNFKKILKKHLENNGLIIGVSAGSIILTPNISVCNLPETDENLVGITDLTALNLVDFEFYPHFTGNKQYLEEIKKYSKTINNPVYVCSDENGIFIDENKIEILNNIIKI
ncbi:MAG: Type 1 glutamine amidotransferase-like domain-containing protein [Candidatus Daviesbacteria bacterium]|nr:Type 1 glutamine amidotransferase-like domain-containing protein [Candidatus Daviesbacteria bacterium]